MIEFFFAAIQFITKTRNIVISSPEHRSNPDSSTEPQGDGRFRLDPAKFPRPLELELSAELMEQLEAMASRSGRSLSDLITDLLSQQVDPPA